MPYYMLALRYLYGTKAFATEDNVYVYQDSAGTRASNIVDDGGIDTLDFSALTGPVVVNLTPGAYSSVGSLISGAQAQANLTISLDAVIERVIGTSGADIFHGNHVNKSFIPGAGNDAVDGSAGIDTVVQGSPKAAYSVVRTATGYTVTDNGGSTGVDTLSDIERLVFSDGGKLALDLSGNAGLSARLLGVALGKASVSNPAFVGLCLNLLDGGMGFEGLSTALMNFLGKTTAADALTLMWTNLVGSTPDPAQITSLVNSVDNPSAGALTVMVANLDLTAQHVGLIGLADTGLAYS